ncbi:MAG: formylglycine-generating enzyme family protein [Minicystis sp.]
MATLLVAALLYINRTQTVAPPPPPLDAGIEDATPPMEAGPNDAGLEEAGPNDAGLKEAGPNDAGLPERPTRRRTRELVFTVEPPPSPHVAIPFALSLAALAFIAGLIRWVLKERWLPRYPLLPRRDGPPERPLLPLTKGATGLLTASARDDLAFAVDRFVRDEPSPELDLPRTIEATIAEGGRPALVFRRRTEHRTVRLWVDTGSRSPLVARFAVEAHAALLAAGLPCDRAAYYLVPDSLESDEHGPLAPHDLDDAAHSSAVLLITDGLRVAERLAQPAALEYATPVLRLLARWPRVAFVVVSADGRKALSPLGTRFGLTVLGPDEVDAFLEGNDRRAQAGSDRPLLAGDILAWEAACALSPRPVDVPVALALRAALGIAPPPWALDLLLAETGVGDRLVFSDERRALRLRWLLDQSRGTAALPVREKSLLARALGFWRARYAAERRAREAREKEEAWEGTPAHQKLLGEEARLDLWDKPEEAAEALCRLLGTPRAEEKTAVLQGYAVRLHRGDEVEVPEQVMLLPWAMGDLEGNTPAVLQGFGLRVLGAKEVRWSAGAPGRVYVAVGLAAGVLLGGGLTVGARWVLQEKGVPVCSAADGATCEVVPSEGGYEARAWMDGQAASKAGIAAGSAVQVAPGPEQWIPCEEPVGEGVVVRRCGVKETPTPRGRGWTAERSVAVVIGASEVWADLLLDSGSADTVWLAQPGAKPGGIRAPLGDRDQLLVIAPGGKGADADAWLRAWGEKGAVVVADGTDAALRDMFGGGQMLPAAEVWTGAKTLRGKLMLNDVAKAKVVVVPEPDAGTEPVGLIKDSKECPYREDTVNGITLVRVCGGVFLMGDDGEGFDDEKPPHQVQVSSFWIGKYEVSNEQFRHWKGHEDHQKEENAQWPAAYLSWDAAKGFCESLKLQLPTEAQWEYAARGPEARKYPWGKEAATPKLAVMGRGVGEHPDEVTGLSSVGSPFGTVNQSGNVWEWVQDCYDAKAYEARSKSIAVDPVVNDVSRSCGRVLRGGSFWNSVPRHLRSADRRWDSPEDRDVNIGFRCARGLSPQP